MTSAADTVYSTMRPVKITYDQSPLILKALDALGLALANHDHQWTPEERRLYERAVRACKA